MKPSDRESTAVVQVQRSLLLLFVVVILCVPAFGQSALVADEDEAIDKQTVNFLEKKIAAVLTPEQAEAFSAGVDPAQILLQNGETLEEFISRQERTQQAGLVYKPATPCVLLDTKITGERFAGDEMRNLIVRGAGTDYSEHGGSQAGCGIPGLRGTVFKTNAARSLFLTVELLDAEVNSQFSIWPANEQAAPNVGVIQSGSGYEIVSTIVSLCDEEGLDPCTEGDFRIQANNAATDVRITVQGYFEQISDALRLSAQREQPAPGKSTTASFWEEGSTPGGIHYSNGNVGIGTAAPTANLHIQKSEEDARSQLRIAVTGGDSNQDALVTFSDVGESRHWAIGADDSDNVFRLSNSEHLATNTRVLVSSSGKVGIGVNNPERKLHVDGGVQINVGEGLSVLGDNHYFATNKDARVLRMIDNNGSNGYVDGGIAIESYTSSDSVRVPIMAIRGVGNVGIGTKTPASRFVVSMNSFSGSSDWAMAVDSKTNDSSSGVLHLRNSNADSILYARSDGNVGIGTSNPAAKLHVTGAARFFSGTTAQTPDNSLEVGRSEGQQLKIYVSDNGATLQSIQDENVPGYGYLAFVVDDDGTADGYFSFKTKSGTEQVRIAGNGNVGVGTATPTAKLEVAGDIRFGGNLESDGDICIGRCE